jgi:RNA polymerase sigma-70 factor (ECF subfamily)
MGVNINSDIELIISLRRGDVTAFDTFYKKYSPSLYAFGLKLLKSEAETEDLVQSVFMTLWEKRKSLDTELSIKSFIFTIAYNDICKLFRRRKYLKEFIEETVNFQSESIVNIEKRIEYKLLLEKIYLIINKLPDRQKEIFLKSREEGKTSKEIASELGLSPGTIDNYISSGLKFIHSQLIKEGIDLK